jgi:Tol biopolymer transport system component
VRRSAQLTAAVRDSAGNVLSGRTIAWTSSDPGRATVSASGLVSAHARGVVTITATAEGKAGTALLTLAPVLAITPVYPSLFVADTTRLVATLTDAEGNPVGGGIDAWTTGDPNIVAMSGDGIVTGAGVGRVTIAAWAGGSVDSVEVIVLQPRIATPRDIAYIRDTTRFDGLLITSLYLMQADGSGHVRISPQHQTVGLYDWSPTGDRLAVTYYSHNAYGKDGVHVVDADGRNERLVAADALYPRWSPDGSRIAFRTHGGDVYTAAPDGTDLRRLTSAAADELNPEWSPDGRQIAYRVDSPTASELWLMRLDGSDKRRIPGVTSVDEYRWSPDGKQIAFTSWAGSGVWVVGSDGGGQRRVDCDSTGCAGGSLPDWSPDATRLAFTHTDPPGSPAYVHVVNRDGTGRLDVVVWDACCGSVHTRADWSPDGQHLAYVTRQVTDPHWPAIAVMAANGTGQTILTGDFTATGAVWRP